MKKALKKLAVLTMMVSVVSFNSAPVFGAQVQDNDATDVCTDEFSLIDTNGDKFPLIDVYGDKFPLIDVYSANDSMF